MNRAGSSLVLSLSIAFATGCASLPKEKRIEEPIKASYSVTDPEFENSMSFLLGAPFVDGNRVVELLNGDQVFPAMIDAIRSAEKSVCFESYIWSAGKLSRSFTEALVERARAGVKVHIIVDSIGGTKFSREDLDALTEAGAEFVKFNPPIPFKLFRINHRTHRKLLIVDGRIGFTGGICISDDWLGDGSPPNWRDTHFRVEGPVVGQMQAAFMDNWLQMQSEVLHGERYFPDLKPVGTMKAQLFRSGPRDGAENARLAYLLAIAAAREHIRLAHAYFVPDDMTIDTLIAARKRGVKVEVIVPAKIDNAAVRKASRSRWGELLDAGVEFYEFEPTLYHCKIMIVDDVWSTAGSVNFDSRSFHINDEANISVLDRDFAALLIRTFEQDKAKSRRLSANDFQNRNWFGRLTDHTVGFLLGWQL